MAKEYYIEICENEEDSTEESYEYLVCVYEKDGDGCPVIEHYNELDISNTGLELLLCDDLGELGVSIDDCEVIRDY